MAASHSTKTQLTAYISLTGNHQLFPKLNNDKRPASTLSHFTQSDAHGNFFKIFETIRTHTHLIECDPAIHKEINQIYRKWLEAKNGEIDESDLLRLGHIIYHELKINPQAVGCYTFIGDTICDRGPHDLPTFQLFDVLVKAGAPIVTIASNHDMEFILACERILKHRAWYDQKIKEFKERDNALLKKCIDIATQQIEGQQGENQELDLAIAELEKCQAEHDHFIDSTPRTLKLTARMTDKFVQSMLNLQKSIDLGTITFDSILALLPSYYSTLRLFNYSVTKDANGNSTGFTLYSHGVIGLRTVFSAANKLGIKTHPYDAYDTPEKLGALIDQINAEWQQHLLQGRVANLFNDIFNVDGKPNVTEKEMDDHPFAMAIWARRDESTNSYVYRPEKLNGFNMSYVHGHDSRAANNHSKLNIENAADGFRRNNFLGMSNQHIHGNCSVLYSTETPALKLPQAIAVKRKIRKKADITTDHEEKTPTSSSMVSKLGLLSTKTPLSITHPDHKYHQYYTIYDKLIKLRAQSHTTEEQSQCDTFIRALEDQKEITAFSKENFKKNIPLLKLRSDLFLQYYGMHTPSEIRPRK